MHRSPLPVLVIVAAMAACSTRDASAETELLSQDSTLVARLAMVEAPRRPSLPDGCGAVPVAARPAVADRAEAERLARQGYDAEALGNLQEARSLLRRASELDGTNESAAYHLGRTHEALGDRTAAVGAYCRFLALTPTPAESADARQRVARLSQPAAQLAVGSVGDATPVRRRARAAAPRRVAPRPSTVERSLASSSRARGTLSASAGVVSAEALPSPRDPVSSAPAAEDAAGRTATAGEVVAAAGQEPTVVPPTTASRTSSGGLGRAQRAGIGAAAGAIIGAATGRSVKGALIGAAAGGVLGTVIGGRLGPAGRGIRP